MRRLRPFSVLFAALVLVLAGTTATASSSANLQGTVTYGSFVSTALSGRISYSIYPPGGYATSGKRYPVIYYLHGLPATATSYRSIDEVAAAVDASGRQAIVVGVQGARDGDRDPAGRHWGKGRNWETATAKELVSLIDQRYRTIAERSGRILVGTSAGGYGATLIA